METLTLELQQATARRNSAQSRFMAELPQPKLDASTGYAACKHINDAHQARLRAATIERDAAIAAYESVKARFFAAFIR